VEQPVAVSRLEVDVSSFPPPVCGHDFSRPLEDSEVSRFKRAQMEARETRNGPRFRSSPCPAQAAPAKNRVGAMVGLARRPRIHRRPSDDLLGISGHHDGSAHAPGDPTLRGCLPDSTRRIRRTLNLYTIVDPQLFPLLTCTSRRSSIQTVAANIIGYGSRTTVAGSN